MLSKGTFKRDVWQSMRATPFSEPTADHGPYPLSCIFSVSIQLEDHLTRVAVHHVREKRERHFASFWRRPDHGWPRMEDLVTPMASG